MKILNSFLVTFAVLAFSGCGGDSNSLTSPDRSSIPQVAGNYSGTLTAALPELGERMDCPASTVVTQTGSVVSVAALTLSGECGSMSIPMGQATIDSNGSFPNESGTYTEPSCGTYSYTLSGGFFGRELRFSVVMTSSTCLNINANGTLSR